MKTCLFYGLLVMAPWLALPVVAAAVVPKITGTPVIDAPPQLDWPLDQGILIPNLNDPTADLLHDLHGEISAADLVLSTEGNYHMALKDIWPAFLAKFQDAPLANWFYTTSPPVPLGQIANQRLQIGNLILTCRPAAVVATRRVMDNLHEAGLSEGPVLPLYQDRGVVILVKKGNPKGIRTVWDLGRQDVRLVTPNPQLEPGAFENYAGSLYHMASHDKKPPSGMSAARLFALIFQGGSHDPGKWLAGPRIHHRDLPWSLAYGRADAALIYYHLGRYTQETFPELFELVPLGGSLSDPQPAPGTIITTRYLVRIKGDWSPRQLEAREKLVETLLSPEFTRVLEKRGLLRPPVEKEHP
jgi:hypothetical protein